MAIQISDKIIYFILTTIFIIVVLWVLANTVLIPQMGSIGGVVVTIVIGIFLEFIVTVELRKK